MATNMFRSFSMKMPDGKKATVESFDLQQDVHTVLSDGSHRTLRTTIGLVNEKLTGRIVVLDENEKEIEGEVIDDSTIKRNIIRMNRLIVGVDLEGQDN